MKPFEKFRDIDRDTVRLAWFTADDDVVNRVVLGGDPLQSEEVLRKKQDKDQGASGTIMGQ